jgi:hypothetical protein
MPDLLAAAPQVLRKIAFGVALSVAVGLLLCGGGRGSSRRVVSSASGPC